MNTIEHLKDKRERERERERALTMAIGVAIHLSTTSFHLKTTSSPTKATSSPQELIRSGLIRPIPPKDAAQSLKSEGFRLLDIRPTWEHDKAHVSDSLHVPLFVADTNSDPLTLLKKWVHFGYIGLWTGQLFTTINAQFLSQVEDLAPDKDEKLLVACGEGLRSMIALRMLHEGGYKNLGWLAGGFNRSKDGDFGEVEGRTKLQYATVGGASYIFLQLLIFLQVFGKES